MRIARFEGIFKLLSHFFSLVIFLSLIFLYTSDLRQHYFHIDEHSFIRKTYFYDLFFIKRDFSDPRWQVDDWDQPRFGPYVYGLTLHLAGFNDLEKTQRDVDFNDIQIGGQKWWWGLFWKKLDTAPKILAPALNLIYQGRKTAVLFSLAGLLSLYSLTAFLKLPPFSHLSTLMVGINGLMFDYGRRAMTDSMQIFGFFFNLWLIFLYLKAHHQQNKKNLLLASVAIGISAAFTTGVKLSGILALVFFLEIFAVLSWLEYLKNKLSNKFFLRTGFFSLAVVLLVFFAIFIVFHPYLYQDAPRRFFSMFFNRLASVEEFKERFPVGAVYGKGEAVSLVLQRTLLPGNYYGNFGYFWLPIDLVLFLWGSFLLLQKAQKRFLDKRQLNFEGVLIFWVFSTMLALVGYLGNDWPRYYLPTMSGITIVQSYALAFVFNRLWRTVGPK